MPLLEGASVTTSVPGAGAPPQWSFQREGRFPDTDTPTLVSLAAIGDDYFRTVNRAILRGRSFDAFDGTLRVGSRSSMSASRRGCSRLRNTLRAADPHHAQRTGGVRLGLGHDRRCRADDQSDQPAPRSRHGPRRLPSLSRAASCRRADDGNRIGYERGSAAGPHGALGTRPGTGALRRTVPGLVPWPSSAGRSGSSARRCSCWRSSGSSSRLWDCTPSWRIRSCDGRARSACVSRWALNADRFWCSSYDTAPSHSAPG